MNQKPFHKSILFTLTTLGALLVFSRSVQAHPYASGVSGTNGAGVVSFIMNEAGANVSVVFEDNTTNAMGVLPKGATNFNLGAHTSFRIICTKQGNGTPALISSDAYTNSVWGSPRGVAVNSNPKNGKLFGRIYAGSSAASGTFGTTLKQKGLYAMNADQTDALGTGTNAFGASGFGTGDGTGFAGSGPWRCRVAPDDTLIVGDSSVAGDAVYQYTPDLAGSNLVLAGIGRVAGVAAGTHGGLFGTPLITGSIAGNDLVLWTADANMGAPATATLGPGTSPGSFNCIYRFDIGAGPLPWSRGPNYAYTMGLDGIPGLRTEMTLGKDGKIIAGFGRANGSNPCIQILNPAGDTWLYTGGQNPPANQGPPGVDPWAGINGSGAAVGTYAGVRVSPDGRFLASVDLNNGITLANLTNGIPDDASLTGITNSSGTGNSRGMDWDVANNIYVISSGQGLLRIYSLGLTTTCITSNDFTGTNGSFNLVLPPLTASVVATTPDASQNYGTPIPGVFTITLSTNSLTAPLTVNLTRSGTAGLNNGSGGPTNNYTMNLGTNVDGVAILSNSIIFPSGAWPHVGNWSVQVQIIPTPIPVSTNTLTVVLQVLGGSAYLAGSPARDTVYLQNTGPQLLLLSAAASGTTMYRGVTNDYAKFVITRLGDTNGPGNSLGNITSRAYTVTNVSYFGTATYPADYTARAQRLDPLGNGALVPPVDGPTAILFNPGDTAITCAVGNPVRHANLITPPVDRTIIVNLTNTVACPGCTNLTSSEGLAYTVGTATATLTEIDNAVGPEFVLWSNPLTNAADSVNWTLAFAATNFDANPVLPAVFPNYANNNYGGGTNDFDVTFGRDISFDALPQSQVMAASNWNNVLKMSVNKNTGAHAGVNVYPQGQNFRGNYALRFNMFISPYGFGLNNPGIGAPAREFALFGVNHRGTNCNWRTAAPIGALAGNSPTNSDGQWFAVGAASGSITPADFDAFIPPALPNNTASFNDRVSATALSQNGIFKHPPFDAMNVVSPTVGNPGGGEPVNKWVDVSVEITRQTNVSLFINRSPVLTAFSLTNGLFAATNGTIMLGYLDPVADISDYSAFACFSNIRVVELSPYILLQPGLTNTLADRLIVTQGSSLTFTSSASFATAPITNTWYRGTGTAANPGTGVPTAGLQTNIFNGTSMTDSLTWTFNTTVDATNYMSVFSDAAGSVTSRVVAVEVVFGPTNRTYNCGVNSNLLVVAVGPLAPTALQWYFNTSNNISTATKLTFGPHYGPTTNASLFLTNIVAGDAGYYWCAVTNVAGYVIPEAATLAVTCLGPSGAVVAPVSQNNLWGSNTTFTVTASGTTPLTYQWKRDGVNLTNSTHYSGVTGSSLTISNITAGDTASYTAGVTNNAGGTLSSAGVLTEVTPAPTINGSLSFAGGNVALPFTSTNPYDRTNSFILQSSIVVTGPYTNNPAGVFSGSNPNFQVVVPAASGTLFFRLKHTD